MGEIKMIISAGIIIRILPAIRRRFFNFVLANFMA
jgi:hypothetical protein